MAYLSGNVICRGVVPQLVTVLGTELIRALRALGRRVGAVPETLGYIMTHSSQTSQAAIAITTSETA